MSVNEVAQEEIEITPDAHAGTDENELTEIVDSVQEAQYFDASSMAPLTPASVVRMLDACLRVKR
jgi:hypothetical protein